MTDNSQPQKLIPVVLAADRGPGDPVAAAAGVPCKCLTTVDGVPMVVRVLDALAAAERTAAGVLCGPPRHILDAAPLLRQRLDAHRVRWMENQATPSTSALAVLNSLPPQGPVLLTTGDHALLSPAMIDYFCAAACDSGCDLVAAVASHAMIAAAYPGMRRTVVRLRDGGFCGCNLFAFMTPRARSAADFWRRVERQRKKPLRVIGVLGLGVVFRYLTGRLTLEEAIRRLSKRLGLSIHAVRMPFPEAAVDVDTAADWRLVEDIAAGRYRKPEA